MYPDDGDMEVRRLQLMAGDPTSSRRRRHRSRETRILRVLVAFVLTANVIFGVSLSILIWRAYQ